MSGDSHLKLPATLDFRAAAPLREALLAQRGAAIVVEGDDVERIGGQCIQVLVSAKKTWAHDSLSFVLSGASEEMMRTLGYVGLQDFFKEQATL